MNWKPFILYLLINILPIARIAGVNTQKDTKGNITHVTINTKKHPEAVGKLKELGLMEKTQFEKDCEDAISVDEAREHSINYLKSIWPR